MAGGIDLTTLIAQLPHLSKIATAEHSHPGVQKTLLFQNALVTAQQGREQVEKVHQTEATRKVKEKQKQRNHQEQQGFTPKEESQKEDDDVPTASNASPWSGNILNIKV